MGRAGTPIGGSAPTFVNSGSISPDVNSTNATASTSGTPSSGETLLAHVTIVGSAASVIGFDGTEGWTLVRRHDTPNMTVAVYRKRWGSGGTDVTSIAFTGTAGNMRLIVTRVSGAAVSPVTDSAGGGNGIDDANLISPTATGAANQLVMRFYGAAGTGQQIDTPGTAAYETTAAIWTAGLDGAMAMSYETSSANPVGTETATLSVSVTDSKAAVTVVLTG